jgi:hypothetical protein
MFERQEAPSNIGDANLVMEATLILKNLRKTTIFLGSYKSFTETNCLKLEFGMVKCFSPYTHTSNTQEVNRKMNVVSIT